MSSLRPIVLEPYNDLWPYLYEKEAERILQACHTVIAGIEHIGSTSVPGLAAKPTIDIIIGVVTDTDAGTCKDLLRLIDYDDIPDLSGVLPGRYHFLYQEFAGLRTFQIHLAKADSDFWHRHIRFRDHLRENPKAARQYEILKQELAEKHSPDVNTYADAKTDFIAAILKKAR